MTRFTSTIRALLLVPPLLAGGPALVSAQAPKPAATTPAPTPAQAPAPNPAPQATFATPEDAVTAFLSALRTASIPELLTVLGPGSEALVESGDPVADAEGRRQFLALYAERHALTAAEQGRMILDVGHNPWPMPIPLVQGDGKWRFDSKAGAQELVDRRIGRNEIAAIRSALAYVDAQALYKDLMGAARGGRWEYAQRLISQKGKRDGLYWPGSPDAPDASPLAQIVADAREHGYPGTLQAGKQMPYQGYLFRILKAQGMNAPGGQRDYVVNGRMTGGFALVAWPAIYGASGLMTFIVNQDGVVFQRDLGPQTAKLAQAMTLFDPDLNWARVDIQPQ